MHCGKLTRSAAASLTSIKVWILFCMLLNAVQQPSAVQATDDVANVSPCELEGIIKQLVNPSPEYQLHANALKQQLRNILREKQLDQGEEQSLDYDYQEQDKRSVAALAAQGLLSPKRSLANLAKNGQLPSTNEPEEMDENDNHNEEKRYLGALARSGGMMSYGKRNIGTLARDFQLPQNGKRNVATLARQGLLKRNVAAVARYNSMRMGNAAAEKRNLGALKASPVHGAQQKREGEEYISNGIGAGGQNDFDYADFVPSYYMYPSYADLDWGDFGHMQKRFLDTSKDPELFGIENAQVSDEAAAVDFDDSNLSDYLDVLQPAPAKRHIGAVYRSGFLPSYRYLRSPTGGSYGNGGGGIRFSRSGRARQFVEYSPQLERLRQPTAAACKRCFLPNRSYNNWGAAGIRGRLTKFLSSDKLDNDLYNHEQEQERSIITNALPTFGNHNNFLNNHNHVNNERRVAATFNAWGTPPRITALHQRTLRQNTAAQKIANEKTQMKTNNKNKNNKNANTIENDDANEMDNNLH